MTEPNTLDHDAASVPAERHNLGPLPPPATTPEQKKGTATGAGKDLTNLDVLRAVAVLGVLFMHMYEAITEVRPRADYGSEGVALFFIHTALVLMWSLDRRPNTLDFYIRRVARIYPLSIVLILVAVVGHIPVGAWHTPEVYGYGFTMPTFAQLLQHLLLIQNLFRSYNFILYPMWSLPVELQMYLVLPIFFFFIERNRKVWPLLLLWVVAFLYMRDWIDPRVMTTVSAVSFFLPGILAYVGFSKWKPVLPAWLFPFALGLATVLGAYANNIPKRAIVTLAFGMSLPLFRQMAPGVLTKTAWYIARYSYGIYLLHPFAIWIAMRLIPGLHTPGQIAVTLVTLTAMTVPAYHWLEAPCIRWGGKLASRIANSKPAPPPLAAMPGA